MHASFVCAFWTNAMRVELVELIHTYNYVFIIRNILLCRKFSIVFSDIVIVIYYSLYVRNIGVFYRTKQSIYLLRFHMSSLLLLCLFTLYEIYFISAAIFYTSLIINSKPKNPVEQQRCECQRAAFIYYMHSMMLYWIFVALRNFEIIY